MHTFSTSNKVCSFPISSKKFVLFFVIADGKEFDAYISIGKHTNDLKFVEQNVVDILKRRYGYKFFVDEDNLLPQLGN